MLVHEVEKCRACATSAMRNSSNQKEIVKQIQKETGISIDIIDGKTEAEIIYSTQIVDVLSDEGTYLWVDVGGGSTEVSLFHKGRCKASRSFQIGTIRLLNKGVSEDQWKTLKKWLKEVCSSYKDISLIGSGGNINKLYKMSGQKPGGTISNNYLAKMQRQLETLSYEERVRQLDMGLSRADVITFAIDIFIFIMKSAKARKVYVPKVGLADGIVRKMYEEDRHLKKREMSYKD